MSKEFKYLAIKNWEKYQSSRGKSSWVKDWTDKDSDSDYAKLTAFQRYVLDGCRRLRGRFGKNVNNDPTHIARALNMLPTERARVVNTLATLIERRFLVLTNQADDYIDKIRIEEIREEKEDTKPISPSADEKPKFILPGWIEKNTWEDYEQMRRRIGKPMTDRARNLAVDKLADLQNRGHPVSDVLKQSIFNSWQGIFPLKEMQEQGNGKQNIPASKAEERDRRIEENTRKAFAKFAGLPGSVTKTLSD